MSTLPQLLCFPEQFRLKRIVKKVILHKEFLFNDRHLLRKSPKQTSEFVIENREVAVMADDKQQHYFIDGPGRMTNALQILAQKSNHEHQQHHQQQPPPQSQSQQVRFVDDEMEGGELEVGPRTIVASDSEVSNGFVSDGKRLPYVFETTESGTKKRTSRILPVCGVCGKKFVCVTTMKRHLVTHTGEKPFACKICGKQYTQKGNLRVHERTHRNDRPFECNICHQKFYRKEPMQKHQWRQHGIVHFKSRPPCPLPQNTPVTSNSDSPQIPIQMASSNTNVSVDGVLYNSIVDRIKNNSLENFGESSRHLDGERVYHQRPRSQSPTSRETNHADERLVIDLRQSHKQSDLDEQHHLITNMNDPSKQTEKTTSSIRHVAAMAAAALNMTTTTPPTSRNDTNYELSPTHSYNTDNDLTSGTHQDVGDTSPSSALSSVAYLNLHHKDDNNGNSDHEQFSDRRSRSSSSPPPQMRTNEVFDYNNKPLKLKKKFADAYYAQEIEKAEIEHSQIRHDQVVEEDIHEDVQNNSKESVECQCKSCGHVFVVSDPYNFRCSHCNLKYTSLPTHMIADPLQCIGCCQVFPHKPSLKAHQICSEDKERPFKCCKCGYRFRQKAHLQKHQWRIHRRKGDSESNGFSREMDSAYHANTSGIINNSSKPVSADPTTTITLQDIIDRGVERQLIEHKKVLIVPSNNLIEATNDDNSAQPLDLSPSKMIYKASTSEISNSTTLLINDSYASSTNNNSNSDLRIIRESNPLLNQRPALILGASESQTREEFHLPEKTVLSTGSGYSLTITKEVARQVPMADRHQEPVRLDPRLPSNPPAKKQCMSHMVSSELTPMYPKRNNPPEGAAANLVIRAGFLREQSDSLRSGNLRTV